MKKRSKQKKSKVWWYWGAYGEWTGFDERTDDLSCLGKDRQCKCPKCAHDYWANQDKMPDWTPKEPIKPETTWKPIATNGTIFVKERMGDPIKPEASWTPVGAYPQAKPEYATKDDIAALSKTILLLDKRTHSLLEALNKPIQYRPINWEAYEIAGIAAVTCIAIKLVTIFVTAIIGAMK